MMEIFQIGTIWFLCEFLTTFHKKTLCLTQKYPNLRDTLASLVFHALFKSPLLSKIEATFQTVFQFSFFFKTFTLLLLYNFCLFPKNCRKFHQYNHATKENRRTSWVRWFCFHPPLRSKSHSKWKMKAIWRPLN